MCLYICQKCTLLKNVFAMCDFKKTRRKEEEKKHFLLFSLLQECISFNILLMWPFLCNKFENTFPCTARIASLSNPCLFFFLF